MIPLPDAANHQRTLLTELRWLTRLRWLAGSAVLLLAAGVAAVRGNGAAGSIALIGLVILAYNALLLLLHRRRPPVIALAWTHILLDLAALTFLCVRSGGPDSPLLGLFVLHMVFASLFLPRVMAYCAAAAAVGMLAAALAIAGQWPGLDALGRPQLALAGWSVALVLTVFLANHLTLSLRRQRSRLAHRNRRIRALADRLARQQQALVQHEKMVAAGQMAAGIAHEIANPLANMDSILQLMQRNSQRLTLENVATLRQQVDRIKLTVQQLTSFAHPVDSTWQEASLADLVESGLEWVRFDRRRGAVTVEKRFPAQPVRVRCQPHAVQQVLINLIINAMDAMAETPRRVMSVDIRSEGDFGVIAIADTGHGIAPEHMERVFEPFFTTKPVGKGTGLGLAISYNLIRNQGGRIEVHSQIRQGTTVSIYLPLAAAAQPAHAVAAP